MRRIRPRTLLWMALLLALLPAFDHAAADLTCATTPLPAIDLDGGTYRDFVLTPDGETVLVQTDVGGDGLAELYAITLADGPARPLSASLADTGGVLEDFQPGPDGARVVYRLETADGESVGLYSAALASGDVAPLRESGPDGGRLESFQISPEGGTVVFSATQDGMTGLYRAPIDGGEVVQLAATISPVGSDPGYALTPDGGVVVYRTAVDSNANRYALHAVSLAGGEPVLLTDTFTTSPDYPRQGARFALTADGAFALYRTPHADGWHLNLHSVPLGGGPPLLLAETLGQYVGQLPDFALSAAGYAVYYADHPATGPSLYSVPVAGGEPILLADNFHTFCLEDRYCAPFRLTPDGATLLYIGDAGEWTPGLFVVPVAGGPPIPLGALPDGTTANVTGPYWVSGDGARAIFRSYARFDDGSDLYHLYSVPLTGGAPTSLAGEIAWPEGLGMPLVQLNAEGDVVLFLSNRDDNLYDDLYALSRVSVTGEDLTLLAEAVPFGLYNAFDASADGNTVVYRAMVEGLPGLYVVRCSD